MTTNPTSNPLSEIESRVHHAKDEAVDLTGTESIEAIERLIDDEIDRWNADHRRGLQSFPLHDAETIGERALRNLTGYGPLGPLLADDDVWEIMVNAPDAVFVKRHRGPSGYHDEVFHDDDHVVRTLTKILDDSTQAHRKLDPSEGLQDAQLDDGARLHIVHGDVARGGHVMVNIRKFTGVTFRTLDELAERGMLTNDAARFLHACVKARQTIIFAGAPGAGKTTMLNCCAAELDPRLRVVVAEEVFEADIPLPNVASMQTRAGRTDRPAVDLRRLVAGFLRMAPDVAIVGEVRDREALPLLLTLSSGVKGFTTIHAGSARQALTRLRFICQLADTSNELPMSALTSLVAEAIDVVVHCTRSQAGPLVSSIVAVEDLSAAVESGQFTSTEVFRRDGDGPLEWTGLHPARLGRSLAIAAIDLHDIFRLPARGAVGSSRSRCPSPQGQVSSTSTPPSFSAAQTSTRSLSSPLRRRRAVAAEVWLRQAGLDHVDRREFAGVVTMLFVLAFLVGYAAFGAVIPSAALGVFGSSFPFASYRHRRRARRLRAREAWPRMIEEVRVQTGSLGRSIPNALFHVGARGPDELRPSFAAAHREWLLTTDLAKTFAVLKDRLADPTADMTCETLLVAHELGGTDLDGRLEALADDRLADVQGRKDARSRQAGARFARIFVLLVPAGMALAGTSIGNGRESYRSPVGQVIVMAAILLVIGCWVWAGRVMRLPEPDRVFRD